MNRRDLIRNALLSAGALSSPGALAQQEDAVAKGRRALTAAAKRSAGGSMPNILWVCTDQQRFDTIEKLSNSVIHTPNLARFAREAVTFTNVFAQTPICSPSRGSFLTGRYPHCTGLRANGQRIRPTERLITRILADYEYTCGLAGKMHLSPCFGGRIEDRIDDG